VSGKQGKHAAAPPLSPDFRKALTRETLQTEVLRVKALIGTMTGLVVLLTGLYFVAPWALERIWQGEAKILYLYAIYVPFLLFEISLLVLLNRQIARDRDVPLAWRYLGAFIETSLPTAALAVHIDSMGLLHALAFVAPLSYFIFIILSTLRLDFWLSTFTGLVAAIELFAIATLSSAGNIDLSIGYHFGRSMILLVGGLLAGAVGAQLRRQFEASIAAATQRDHITNLFGQHVSPQVVERLLASGAGPASDTRKVAVMFVDIRGFTAAARSRSPQEVVERLNVAFSLLVDIVDRNGGIVNKFLGDGFLALFGAPIEEPDPAHRAVAAAREILAAIALDNEGRAWPLRIGIGLHLGDVVAGNVGSPRRKEYTVIGDTVNLASRIEALNKEFGSQLLVSDTIRAAAADAVADAMALDGVQVRGYDLPMKIWRLA